MTNVYPLEERSFLQDFILATTDVKLSTNTPTDLEMATSLSPTQELCNVTSTSRSRDVLISNISMVLYVEKTNRQETCRM